MNLENAGHYRKHYRLYNKKDASYHFPKICSEIKKQKFLCCMIGTSFISGFLLGCLFSAKKR